MRNDKNKTKLIENYIEQHYGNTADDGMKAKQRLRIGGRFNAAYTLLAVRAGLLTIKLK